MKNSLNLYYSRIFFLRDEIDRLLLLSIIFSIGMTSARTLYSGHITFIFLIWNLFLAWIPYCISQWLYYRQHKIKSNFLVVILFAIWLAFVPNTFYILTDLYHIGDNYNDFSMPQWFDLAMLLSFAWNGLLLGILSVRHIEKVVIARFRIKHELLFLYPVMWQNAFGIYIGRYLRFNSWDVISDPFHLIRDIAGVLLHPFTERYATGMIFCFSILITLIYLMLKKLSKAIV
ncbi:MAG TPA: DUF1361 domain-containing protein [Puia sp.]|nr:DUF1361 domain-containing protein [Puia sp.]